MQLSIHGAGQTVTGSLHRVKTKHVEFLVDCGLFQGKIEDVETRNKDFGFNPKNVDYVILTHSHLDHCGRLPLLVRAGFRGPIYTTAASAELCTLLLEDVAKTEEEDAARARYFARKTGKAKQADLNPLFTEADANQVSRQLKKIKYNKKIALPGNVTLQVRDAGHILGSSIIETWVEERNRVSHFVFSGDIGRPDTPILRDPDFPNSSTYLICESTYANRNHGPLSKSILRFKRLIIKAHRHNSHILVPAFAIGRTQTIIYALNHLVENAQVPIIPVAIDSPLAIKATEIFKHHPECFDTEMKTLIEAGDVPLDFKGLQYVEREHASDLLTEQSGPALIIAGSGMMNGGRILRHLFRRIDDAKTTILVPGFQAPGTLGNYILGGARSVHLYGQRKRVRARIERLYGFSSHADKTELQSYLRHLRQDPPRMVFCVHGSPKACHALTKITRSLFRTQSVAPTIGQSYQLQ